MGSNVLKYSLFFGGIFAISYVVGVSVTPPDPYQAALVAIVSTIAATVAVSSHVLYKSHT